MTFVDLDPIDQHIVFSIISNCLGRGDEISVDADGWEFPARSKKIGEILDSLCQTDIEHLIIHYKRDGLPHRGTITLVYGNEPGVIVADHTDVPEITCVVDEAISLATGEE